MEKPEICPVAIWHDFRLSRSIYCSAQCTYRMHRSAAMTGTHGFSQPRASSFDPGFLSFIRSHTGISGMTPVSEPLVISRFRARACAPRRRPGRRAGIARATARKSQAPARRAGASRDCAAARRASSTSVGLAGAHDLVRLRGRGDQADGAGGNSRFAPDALGERAPGSRGRPASRRSMLPPRNSR